MAAGQIPDDVVRFIVENLDTVPHLEALLLIWSSAPAAWAVAQIAARVYVTEEVAAKLLEDLVKRGLLLRIGSDPPAFSFNAAYDADKNIMQKVAGCYRTHLVRVANLIHMQGSGAVRDFARAFKLKDKD
jgi:hypothetical protein